MSGTKSDQVLDWYGRISGRPNAAEISCPRARALVSAFRLLPIPALFYGRVFRYLATELKVIRKH
jgi:hypothetical protein